MNGAFRPIPADFFGRVHAVVRLQRPLDCIRLVERARTVALTVGNEFDPVPGCADEIRS